MEGGKGAGIQFVPDTFHQMIVEPQIVHHGQAHTQHLICLEQVPDVGAGIVAAHRAAAGGINGTLVPLILGILDVNDAAPCIQVAVAGIAAGHNAVKQIHTTGLRPR